MNIQTNLLVPLMEAFSALSRSEQRVFLFCLNYCPRPVMYSSDLRSIAASLDIHPRTVERTLRKIKKDKILSICVYPVKFNHKEELIYETEIRQANQSRGY